MPAFDMPEDVSGRAVVFYDPNLNSWRLASPEEIYPTMCSPVATMLETGQSLEPVLCDDFHWFRAINKAAGPVRLSFTSRFGVSTILLDPAEVYELDGRVTKIEAESGPVQVTARG